MLHNNIKGSMFRKYLMLRILRNVLNEKVAICGGFFFILLKKFSYM